MFVTMPSPSFQQSARRVALAAALFASALTTAQANGTPSLLGVDAIGAPLGNASVHFDFDFGASLPTTAAVVSLNWDPALLSAVGVSTTYQGMAIDAAAALSAAGTYIPLFTPDAGNFGALWSALDSNDQPLPALDLSGLARLSITFMLSPGFPLAQSTPVALSLLLADADGSPLDELSGVANISAVPEPAQWALLLAGGLGLAGMARLRRCCATGSAPRLPSPTKA